MQGEDGEQRCVYVTTNEEGEDGSTVLTLDSAYADAVAQLDPNQVGCLIVLLNKILLVSIFFMPLSYRIL